MKALFQYGIIILFVLTSLSVKAQSFSAKVSSTTIGKRDVVQVDYTADNVAIDQFTLPRYDKWTVVSGPNVSQNVVTNGNMINQQIVYSVILQPNSTGNLVIPGASAIIDNKPAKTQPFTVKVTNADHVAGASPASPPAQQNSVFDQLPVFDDEVPAGQILRKGEKAIDKIKNNIVVRLEVSKHTCYVGEPILATYKLCTRLRSQSKVVKQPQFSGATVVELTDNNQDQHIETINGQQYNVFVIRKVQLIPLAAGKMVLPETSVENKVSFYTADNLSYRDLYYGSPSKPAEEQLVTLQSKPEEITVLPLPPLPSVNNTGFSGAIGNFDFSISSNDDVRTNATNQLIITIQGAGNLADLKQPVVQWPKGIEAFDAKEANEDDKSNFPVRSRKTYAIPFVVDQPGNYTIPPISFTFFNPKTNKYITQTTHPLVLHVLKGQKNILNSLKLDAADDAFQQRLFIILGAGILAIVIGLLWYNGRKNAMVPVIAGNINTSTVEEPVSISKPAASECLFAIRELQPESNSSSFYKDLCKHLQSYLHVKFGIHTEEITAYADKHLDKAVLLHQLQRILNDCSLGMYTPVFTIEEAMQHRLEAIELLQRMEKE